MTTKMYYRPSQQAPYFDQLLSITEDITTNNQNRFRGGDGSSNTATGDNNGALATRTTATTPRIDSAPQLHHLMRRRNSVQTFGDVRSLLLSPVSRGIHATSNNNNSQSSNLTIDNNTNNTNEADAAAGGGAYGRRHSDTTHLRLGSIHANNGLLNPMGIVEGRHNPLSNISSDPRRIHQQQLNVMYPSLLMNSSSASTTTIKPDWRLRDRMKTVGVGLIMALNIGIDPPDLVKPDPCAVLQCWIDPRPTGGMTRTKARELIGERLESQYAKWQLARAGRPLKYRKALDPTVEDVRNLCLRLRSQARNERILIHYNGHGVPRPTDHGDIWVFDKNHTEYISLSVQDLRQWMGKPSIVVLDCSNAGILLPFWTSPDESVDITSIGGEQQQRQLDNLPSPATNSISNVDGNSNDVNESNDDDGGGGGGGGGGGDDAGNDDSAWVRDTIVLCPCSEGEWLPMHPDYPADIFTSCLTTPIPIALRWFIRQNNSMAFGSLNPDAVDNIPGKANDRKTPLGELNWIFTAVTDSIAWNVLPKPLFQRLFRQDLLVASMFRNFLLADRILRSFGCTPVSYPPLPGNRNLMGSISSAAFPTRNSCMADHPLWQAWDLACETMLFQLMNEGALTSPIPCRPSGPNTNVFEANQQQQHDWDTVGTSATTNKTSSSNNQAVAAGSSSMSQQQQYGNTISSPFFSEQLTAFEIWLELADVHTMRAIRESMGSSSSNSFVMESPEQLPVVLQVLLSQVHRIRALKLLQRFLDLGPWAVNLSLSLGIFPYVMKLLQSPEYKSLLVSIWASILAFDPSCRVDLLKDGAIHHFVQHLLVGMGLGNNVKAGGQGIGTNAAPTDFTEAAQLANERTLAAFVLAAICHEYPAGQAECIRLNLHGNCCALLSTYDQQEDQQQNRIRQQVSSQQNQHHSESESRSPAQRQIANADERDVTSVQFPDHFRLWVCMCLANLVKDNTPVQTEVYSAGGHIRFQARLNDKNPEVRAAACYALGCLIGSQSKATNQSMSVQDPSSLQLSSPPSPGIHSQAFAAAPGGTSFMMNQTPNLLVPNSVTVGMASVSGQFRPSFALPTVTSAVGETSLPSVHLQGPPMQSMMSGGIQAAQVHPIILNQQPQQQFWNHEQQQQAHQLMQRQQQQQQQPIHARQYMVQPQQQVHPQHPHLDATAGHQYTQPMFSGGFLVPQGSGLPVVMPHPQPPIANMALNRTHSLVYHQISPQPYSPINPVVDQSIRMLVKPTIFDDRNRLELDLSCLDVMLKTVVHDGSVVVRYEATVALGCAVGKYLEAFVVVAEELLAVSSPLADSPARRKINPPRGLDRVCLDRFMAIWKSIRSLQREDPFPPISKAANSIVSFVHDTLLRFRIESEKEVAQSKGRAQNQINLLSGIHEDFTSDTGPKMPESKNQPIPSRRNHNYKDEMRRVASECATGGSAAERSMEINAIRKASDSISILANLSDDDNLSSYTLPSSYFYDWKKNAFDSSFKVAEDDEHPDPDPLSPTGTARAYQDRRNFVVRENGVRLARRYESLTPKLPEPKKKSIELLLHQPEDENALLAAEKELSEKKAELELEEKMLFHNDRVQRTALLNFHPYEDYLMACGATDVVTLWDTLSSRRLTKFDNGNPKGSRMTSSFWINEVSCCRFLVGCDDGTVRIWSNILESNGECCTSSPSLLSAFHASQMERDYDDSGLILEWQPNSGILIAGGRSKHINCWDLESEKVFNKIETNSDACVSTLTTAWDFDALGAASQAYHGIGRDIVVTGHSDGSLRVFDIRLNSVVNDMRADQQTTTGRRQRVRATVYREHASWVVNTAFRSYTNGNELISGSVDGEIKAWDLRMSTSIRTVEVQRSRMTTMAVHHKIPIVATGSHAQFIKILTLDGDTMQVLRYHEKIANHRIGPVSCLAFHPNKPILAAGATDTYIGLYTTKKQFF